MADFQERGCSITQWINKIGINLQGAVEARNGRFVFLQLHEDKPTLIQAIDIRRIDRQSLAEEHFSVIELPKVEVDRTQFF